MVCFKYGLKKPPVPQGCQFELMMQKYYLVIGVNMTKIFLPLELQMGSFEAGTFVD